MRFRKLSYPFLLWSLLISLSHNFVYLSCHHEAEMRIAALYPRRRDDSPTESLQHRECVRCHAPEDGLKVLYAAATQNCQWIRKWVFGWAREL